MCTIMCYRETLPAENRSREDSQKAVDRLMEYDRKSSADPDSCEAPLFEDHPYGMSSVPWVWGHGIKRNIYVWLDNCRFGNSDKNGFYYVRYQLSMLAWGTTAYAHPVLIVEKSKLRSNQVEYMDRKCRETLEAAKQKQKQLED